MPRQATKSIRQDRFLIAFLPQHFRILTRQHVELTHCARHSESSRSNPLKELFAMDAIPLTRGGFHLPVKEPSQPLPLKLPPSFLNFCSGHS